MNAFETKQILAGWVLATSAWAFGLFGWDKWQAGRRGARVSEAALCLVALAGGWPGGLLGITLFRHKSVKVSFQLKFAAAAVAGAGWMVFVLLQR